MLQSGHAGDHVMDELVVSGHVNKSQRQLIGFEVGEAEIDCQAAAFLFSQAIGVFASQCMHQTGFTVIHVAGKGDDHGCASLLRFAVSSAVRSAPRMSSHSRSCWIRPITGTGNPRRRSARSRTSASFSWLNVTAQLSIV